MMETEYQIEELKKECETITKRFEETQQSLNSINIEFQRTKDKNEVLINNFKNANEEETTEILMKMEGLKTIMEERKIQNAEEKRKIKEGIMQNKMVNNAVCGNIEKLNDELSKQKIN
jgi:hypothetical protein